MAGGGIVQLWNDSGIQIVVLLSFTFQLVLFLFAGIRRRNASALLNLLLWLVYLLADSTAIYALGHLSVTTSHQLVAFWAPLLLVHLGGPDSITAYSIEDTRLWLRHLVTLVVQTLGASYVLYKYVASASSGRALLAASVLMFTVGVLKYGERTWALRCGSMGGIKTRLPPVTQDSVDEEESVGLKAFRREEKQVWRLHNEKGDKEEELLILAHLQLRICMQPFVGLNVWSDSVSSTPHKADDMYKLIQMQLSLMYDIIYTKAGVIHTWHGYCIRVVSLVATVTSMLLFSFSNKNGYSRVDVDITYFLLAGAVVLEIISVLTTIGSTWMCARLCGSQRAPTMLVNGLKFLRFRVGAASKRMWSSSIGQYNLFHICTRNRTELGSRATEKMGLDKWWTRVHFVCTADISKTHLPSLLLETLPKLDPRSSRGIQILERSRLGKEHAGWSHWSLNLDFAQSILIWHLATDIYLIKSKVVGRQDLAQSVKMLSNYMMFLLVTKPDMLPGYIEESWHDETRHSLEERWSKPRFKPRFRLVLEESPNRWWGMLKKQFCKDGPNASRIEQITQLIDLICSRQYLITDYKEELDPGSATYSHADVDAKRVAAELLRLESWKPDLLEVIFGVWLEMLCYAAQRCGPGSHASQLSRGGEFITVVWLLSQRFVSASSTKRYFQSRYRP